MPLGGFRARERDISREGPAELGGRNKAEGGAKGRGDAGENRQARWGTAPKNPLHDERGLRVQDLQQGLLLAIAGKAALGEVR